MWSGLEILSCLSQISEFRGLLSSECLAVANEYAVCQWVLFVVSGSVGYGGASRQAVTLLRGQAYHGRGPIGVRLSEGGLDDGGGQWSVGGQGDEWDQWRQSDPGTQGGQGTYPCPNCDRVFVTSTARKYHVEAVHDLMIFTCVCGKMYKYRSSLQKHLRNSKVCAAQTSHAKSSQGSEVTMTTFH